MKNSFLIICVMAVICFSCTQSGDKRIALFNGEDLTGWTGWLADNTLDANNEFTVKDGVINLSGKYGYLRTDNEYADYTLELDWRWVGNESNSGVFLHAQPEDKQWPHSYEFQLWAGNAGDIINSGGSTCAQYRADKSKMVVAKNNPSNEKEAGQWNSAKIECKGNTLTIYVNGLLQNTITETSVSKGSIALQSEGEAVEFRNIYLTPLK